MKSVTVCLAVVVLVALVEGQGIPTKKCPPGEHSVLYCPRMAEPDCTNPTVHERNTPGACDIPDCFCNTPTVRNLDTGKCVKLEDCPKKK
uniref:TIL n=1 Tax=Ostrinia furnacalis TaxID=93504 RepID=A0A5B9GAP1_OSTFU|nr:TIL [Ostrinia furnacalis]